ncbi:glycosyltransferase [Sphingomonas naphthae]|uniref:Glycosyltransferase n=1 Tax=Sphingomonas naphthae TaxID=1813468 RepID=A0ABY7TJ40_9SPHN|nr:glycosyltransferase family 2 protein [Sphingomonas naphthae]WCT72966.1 glycosyltransferase [Sphingomonas naphthae]
MTVARTARDFQVAHLTHRPPIALAVVIPTFNERDNVAPLLEALENALEGRVWEAIFVDDASTDGTPERIEALAAWRGHVRLIRRIGRRGLSSAIVEGMLATVAPVVAVIDADMQHDEAALPALHDAIARDGADIAIGTRYAGAGSTGDWAESRVAASRLATRLARVAVRAEVSDPLSGFFAIRRDLLIATAPQLSNVGFKILLDLLASMPAGPRIAEVPYRFRCRHAGTSKLDSAVASEYLLLLADKTIGRVVPPRLILFLLVGGLGLMLHLLLLSALLRAGLAFATGQAIAGIAAITLAYTLDNAFTYRDRRRKGARWWRGLLRFTAACAIGLIANVGLAATLYRLEPVWWLAGIAGAAMGAVWTTAATSLLIRRNR